MSQMTLPPVGVLIELAAGKADDGRETFLAIVEFDKAAAKDVGALLFEDVQIITAITKGAGNEG